MEPKCIDKTSDKINIKEEVIDINYKEGHIPYIKVEHHHVFQESDSLGGFIENITSASCGSSANPLSQVSNTGTVELMRKKDEIDQEETNKRFKTTDGLVVDVKQEQIKAEDVWEEEELSIIDYNFCESSLEGDTELHSYGSDARPLRRSTRKKTIRFSNKDIEEDGFLNWDDSDNDPTFSPTDCEDADGLCKFVVSKKITKLCSKKYVNSRKKAKKKPKLKTKYKHNIIKKKYPCYFCNGRFGKLPRHLKRCHSNESEVQHIFSLTKGSQERRLAIKDVRLKGQLNFDKEVYDKNVQEKQIVKLKKCYIKINKLENKSKRQQRHKVRYSMCIYCKSKTHKISKHLQLKHSDKPEVKHFMTHPKGSIDRARAIRLLQNKGNFIYNKNVILNKGNTIIVCKNMPVPFQYCEYLPCKYCLGFYKKKILNRHIKRCPYKEGTHLLATEIEEADTHSTVVLTLLDIINSLQYFEKVNKPIEVACRNYGIKPAKKTACLYCMQLFSKISNHLKAMHSEEAAVKHILSLKKRSKERYIAILSIARKGNFLYNKQIYTDKDKPIITVRTPTTKFNSKDYLPCQFCFGFYKKNCLSRHTYRCKLNKTSGKTRPRNKKISKLALSSSLVEHPIDMKTGTEELLTSLNVNFNGVYTIAKRDKLVIKYGSLLFNKKVTCKKITSMMRLLARVIARINGMNSHIKSLKDSLKAEHFNTVVKATLQTCAGIKIESSILREKNIKEALQHCCMIVKSESLCNNDGLSIQQVNGFLEFIETYWSESYLAHVFKLPELESDKNKEHICENLEQDVTINLNLKKEILDNLNLSISSTNILEHSNDLFHGKKTVCMFCNKCVKRVSNHFATQHKKEPDVKYLSTLKLGSKERTVFLKKLRGKGNCMHNLRVVNEKNGFIIIQQGCLIPYEQNSRFLPCEHCYYWFSYKKISKHIKKCPMNMFIQRKVKDFCSRPKFFGTLLYNLYKNESENLQIVLNEMNNCNLKTIILNDKTISKFGLFMAHWYGTWTRSINKNLTAQLKRFAALFLTVQSLDAEIKSALDCLLFKNFPILLKAAKMISLKQRDIKKTKLFFKSLGNIIHTISKVLKFEYDFNRDETQLKDLEEFIILFSKQWVLTPEDLDDIVEITIPSRAKMHSSIFNYGRWTSEENECVSQIFASHIKKQLLPGKIEIQRCLPTENCLNKRHWYSVKEKVRTIIKQSQIVSSEQNNSNKLKFAQDKHAKPIELLCNNDNGSSHNSKAPIPSHNNSCENSSSQLGPDDKQIKKQEEGIQLNRDVNSSLHGSSNNSNLNHNEVMESHTVITTQASSDTSGVNHNEMENHAVVTNLYKSSGPELISGNQKTVPRFEDLNQKQEIRTSQKTKIYSLTTRNRGTWTLQESEFVSKIFATYIEKGVLPGKIEIKGCIDKTDCLSNRSWTSVKEKVRTIIKRSNAISTKQNKSNSMKDIHDNCKQLKRSSPEEISNNSSLIHNNNNEFEHASPSHLEPSCNHILKKEESCQCQPKKVCNSFLALLSNNSGVDHREEMECPKVDDNSLNKISSEPGPICGKHKRSSQFEDLNKIHDTSTHSKTVLNSSMLPKHDKWTLEQNEIVSKIFASHIAKGVLPGKLEIQHCIDKTEVLSKRNWTCVKEKVRTIIKRTKSTNTEQNFPNNTKINQCNKSLYSDHKKRSSRTNSPIHNYNSAITNISSSDIDTVRNQIQAKEKRHDLNTVYNSSLDIYPGSAKGNHVETEENNFNSIYNTKGEESEFNSENHKTIKVTNENCEEKTYLIIGDNSTPVLNHNTRKDSHEVTQNEMETGEQQSCEPVNTKQPADRSCSDIPKNNSTLKEIPNHNDSGKDEPQVIFESSCSNFSNMNEELIKSKKRVKLNWTKEESEAVLAFFKQHIIRNKVPSKYECEDCIDDYQCLQRRSWVCIKSKVYNLIKMYKSNNKKKMFHSFNFSSTVDSLQRSSHGIDAESDSESGSTFQSKANNGKKMWTNDENKAIKSYFRQHIKSKTVPGKEECLKCLDLYPCLSSRLWVTVKSKVYNLIVRNKT